MNTKQILIGMQEGHDQYCREVSSRFKEFVPVGTRIKKGKQTYTVTRHGMYYNDPFEVTLKNVNNNATIRLNVPFMLRHNKITIISTK